MTQTSALSQRFLLQSATISAVLVAGILVLGKAFAYSLTDSLSIKASLIDSVLDGGVSIVNFFAIRQALEPADDEHRFGHGKVEALAGLFQSLFIAGSSVWLLKEVICRIITPEKLIFHPIAIIVMVVASLLTLVLIMWQRYVVTQTNSIAVAADSLHYKTDLLTNIGVLLSFFLANALNAHYIDWIIAVLIAIYIFKTSYEIGKTSFDMLMDRELPEAVVQQITAIAWENSNVKGVHDLRTRSSGQRIFIQMHLDIDGKLTLQDAHAIAEEIEQNVIAIFPNADVIIHQDPIH
ncbi:MAG: cation diffusion facilitator family transporter [Alphaproteobacteria bacterium]|jgi:ferrous-iron efflux pump FieF|nr:cation diffusion facilitator family transporter [Alphaproteobacteria bacterium]